MTQSVSCTFFYGINYSDSDLDHFKKLLLTASQEIQWGEELRALLIESLLKGHDLGDITYYIDKSWAEHSDPVRIYYCPNEYARRTFSGLCLRETFHSTGSTRGGW